MFNNNRYVSPGEVTESDAEESMPAMFSPEEILELQNKLELNSVKLAQTQDQMMRIAADFENSRKRWDRERVEVRQYSISEFAKDLLPVVDAFDKTLAALEQVSLSEDTDEGKKTAPVLEGVQLVAKVFQDVFKKHGVERLPGKGEPFNPSFHNAVARIVDEAVTQETVVDEFFPGYKIGERILRTSMVRVATPD